MADTISKAEFGRLFKLTDRRIEQLVAEGLPVERSGRHPRFPIPTAPLWYIARKESAAAKKAAPTTIGEAEERLAIAQAEMAELKLAELRRELMTADTYEKVVGDALARVDAKLKHLPQRIAGVAWATDLAEKVRQATPLVDDVRAELWSGDDIPSEEVA